MTLYDDIHAATDEAEAAHNREVAALQARIEELENQEPVPPPEPAQPPTQAKAMPPLIGSSSLPGDWNTRKAQLEATGGKLEARRLFMNPITRDPTSLLKECVQQGLVPVVSFKPSPYSWKQMADGQADAALRTIAQKVKAALGERPLYVAFHHEPDEQSTPKNVGEGGSGAEFGQMQSHVVDVLRPLLPKARIGTIMNGWWWTNLKAKFSDAEFEVWLPRSTRDKLDFIGADDYSAEGGEEAVVKTKNRVAMLKRLGYQGATAVGETNGFKPSDLNNVFGYAKTEPMFAGGFVMLWNSSGESFLPVHETGLLDDFQSILANWRH